MATHAFLPKITFPTRFTDHGCTVIDNCKISNKLDQNLQANPNSNYNILGDYITKVINTHFPIRRVIYNKHKHKKCLWITHDIIKSIKFRDNMYRQLKGTPPDSDLFKNLKININT